MCVGIGARLREGRGASLLARVSAPSQPAEAYADQLLAVRFDGLVDATLGAADDDEVHVVVALEHAARREQEAQRAHHETELRDLREIAGDCARL